MITPTRPRYSRISKEASALIAQHHLSDAPVPIELLAESVGATVVKHNFNKEISGLLLREKGKLIIGVDAEQPIQRQRFTIAHEIGHIVLHDFSDVHVDRNFSVMFRSTMPSTAHDIFEVEANVFAAELLMPEAFLEADTASMELDIEDGRQLSELAGKYQVSVQAITYRLMNLLSRDRLRV